MESVRIHIETDSERACVHVLLDERKIDYQYHCPKDGTLEHWYSIPAGQFTDKLERLLKNEYHIDHVERVLADA